MKKMFFSAVALVGFSATLMANTIEAKESKIENLEIDAKLEIVSPECELKAADSLDALDPNYEWSMEAATSWLNFYIYGCREAAGLSNTNIIR
jgi:hypothetical protein